MSVFSSCLNSQENTSPVAFSSSSLPPSSSVVSSVEGNNINNKVQVNSDCPYYYFSSLCAFANSSEALSSGSLSLPSSDFTAVSPSACSSPSTVSSSVCTSSPGSCICNFSSDNSSSSVINEKSVLKLLALYNKINEDEKLSMQIRTLWKGGDIQMLYNDEIASEIENEYLILKKYIHYKKQDVCSSNTLFCEEHSLKPYRQKKKELIRVFVDGVFDLAHSGHFNAFRQAKALGDVLVVGVNSDEEVYRVKGGYPIYNENERAEIVRGCKWVDEVIVGTPYSVNLNLLNSFNCNFVAHGDDMPLTHDGHDCYFQPRLAGRLRIFKRTEGISTTALVSRLLLATRNIENLVELEFPKSIHKYIEESLSFDNKNSNNSNSKDNNISASSNSSLCTSKVKSIKYKSIEENKDRDDSHEANRKDNSTMKLSECRKCKINNYFEDEEKNLSLCRQTLLSTKRLMQFIDKYKLAPKVNDKIVYVDGSFDILHVGHLRVLQKAKELGDYLIVGIHDDATVHRVKGTGFPVMNLLERALNVLALRVVDEVIIGAPWIITEYLIKSFYIDVVVRGTRIDAMIPCSNNEIKERTNNISNLFLLESDVKYDNEIEDPYEIPKRLGIYKEVESSSSLTTHEIIRRIVDNRITLLSSIQTRKKKEAMHWKDKENGTSYVFREL